MLEGYRFKKKIRKLVYASADRMHRFCSLDDARDILVFYCYEDRDEVAPYIRKLREMGKQVYVVTTSSKTVTPPDDPSVIFISTEKKSNKYKILDAEVCHTVNEIPADILIDVSRGKCQALKALMLQHRSAFKVGERFSDESVYDFSMIMTSGGPGELFEYLLFYLQSIRSK